MAGSKVNSRHVTKLSRLLSRKQVRRAELDAFSGIRRMNERLHWIDFGTVVCQSGRKFQL